MCCDVGELVRENVEGIMSATIREATNNLKGEYSIVVLIEELIKGEVQYCDFERGIN